MITSYKTMILIAALSVSAIAADDTLFKKNCATCHGIKGEKSAVGKSTPIKGMAAAKVVEELNAYASGTKQSALPVAKMIKQRFIKGHSKEEIQEVANYISKL